MMFSVDEYQNFDCSRMPPFADMMRITHLPTGVTLTDVPMTQDWDRMPLRRVFQSGPDANWKALILRGAGIYPDNEMIFPKVRAKALGLPYETAEDKLYFRRNVGHWSSYIRTIACDGHPLPPWTEELVTILLKCDVVRLSSTAWENRTPPPPQEIVFRVQDAPAHLQGMSVIVRYKDR